MTFVAIRIVEWVWGEWRVGKRTCLTPTLAASALRHRRPRASFRLFRGLLLGPSVVLRG